MISKDYYHGSAFFMGVVLISVNLYIFMLFFLYSISSAGSKQLEKLTWIRGRPDAGVNNNGRAALDFESEVYQGGDNTPEGTEDLEFGDDDKDGEFPELPPVDGDDHHPKKGANRINMDDGL